ncbi:hypothetical protein GWN26_01340, partial [Candidatus Saccharibacteria bacterium]|nr:hypothetical protein [Candidatus Saccharibacteria bacterium]NIV03228.1 hypothetical protein [Calditrichia bacterium]NIV71340.1 hypothetical protein [Calditrichia bacterium]NIV97849.1 hypothetical protein [Candidatus Saccharibacteria bacterium]NIW78138.1 hypothetical protein [Calditrichia bacterium]
MAAYVGSAIILRDKILALGIKNGIAIGILVFFAIVVTKIGESIGRSLVERSKFIRKLILGKDYIEGSWVDLSIDHQNKLLRAVALVEIEYQNGSIAFGGQVFGCNGVPVGNFDSSVAGYKNNTLWYVYNREVVFENKEKATGRGELKFTRESHNPTSYYGSFFDTETELEISVEGARIQDKKTLKMLRKQEGKAQVVKEYSERFVNNHPAYRISEA